MSVESLSLGAAEVNIGRSRAMIPHARMRPDEEVVFRPPMPRNVRKVLALTATGVLAAGLAACSGKGDDPPAEADLAAGKRAFLIKCGTCHTMSRAETTGTQGPNLDDAFRRSISNGLGRGGIRGIVAFQIKHANQKPSDPSAFMPRNLVSGEDVGNVAAYVAFVAAKPGQDTGSLFGKSLPTGTNGKLIFQDTCRACHSLRDAKTSGTIGPDLDTVLPGQGVEAIKDSIVDPGHVISPGFRRNVMPKNYKSQFTPAQIQALAAYLARVAGKSRP